MPCDDTPTAAQSERETRTDPSEGEATPPAHALGARSTSPQRRRRVDQGQPDPPDRIGLVLDE